ncbi:MAG: Uncharacterized conserved protein, DUF885 familyt [Chloroflexi bacterium]|nr:MAG: Uncharacterized conserved protein, DUF885 familyt [Chloroflexota bacterium]
MPTLHEIAHDYVDRVAALDPLAATSMGVPGHDHEVTDYSPDGAQARAALDASTLRELNAAPAESGRDRLARDVMAERLLLSAELYAAGEHSMDLNIIASPMQRLRGAFDLMPVASAGDWENIAARLEGVPEALRGMQASLEAGRGDGRVVATRQVRATVQQARTWAGTAGGRPSFFATLIAKPAAPREGALSTRLRDAALAAAAAYDGWAAYLESSYLPHASAEDGVGAERYALRSRVFTGLALDLQETYAWGWEELRRIRAEMAKTAARIVPGGSLAEAVQRLDTDPARAIEGEEPFRQWMQDVQDRTIGELGETHFAIPQPVRSVEAMIAPPGGALAMYYTGPSEDFSRPGRTWYPTGGRTRFPLWAELSVAYHEGVPGHHLQIAITRYQGEALTRYQRLMAGTSGYIEGWALYAERLMSELGYLENPDYYLGYLSSQGLRAARVVVDIGLHLGLTIPADELDQPGEVWQSSFALPFLRKHCFFPDDMLASEVDRYLGWPGQAISYKVGERAWLRARDNARAAAGDGFVLKAFHDRALALGPMGLEQLEREMAAPAS